MPVPSDAPHLPRSAPIEAYGKGGFYFADMSHRGSLLCLPDAIWAWPVIRPEDIDKASLARVFDAANGIDTLIIGTGTGVWLPPPALREALRAVKVVVDTMQTGPAITTYNIMIGERRRVAAALIAVALAARPAEGDPLRAAPNWCGATISPATPPRCSCRRRNAARCWRSTLSTPRFRGYASRSASRCPAKCVCNGGPPVLTARAMAASRAIRSRPNCCWRSAAGICRPSGCRA